MLLSRYRHLLELSRIRIPEPDDMVMRLHRNEKPNSWPEDLLDRDLHEHAGRLAAAISGPRTYL